MNSSNERPNFSKISSKDLDERYVYTAKVDQVIQTSGPTLFKLYDGHGILTAKAFLSPGERAHPEINSDDVIEVEVLIKSYNDELEANIQEIKKVDSVEFKEKIDKILDDKSQPQVNDFSINSKVYNEMKEEFKGAAYEIRKAIYQSRPIIIRHHNDCDGYSAAIALERAILPLIEEHHGKRGVWKYYQRSPSSSPYYDYGDSIRDLTRLLKDSERFDDEKPLVILADLGSSLENELSLELLSVYGVDFVVIDHHLGDFKETDRLSKVHINPHKKGGSSNLTAGMLCSEVARFINSDSKNPLLPVLSGIGDRSNCNEFDLYLEKLREETDFSMSTLRKYVHVVDFQAYHLRFIESRKMMDDLMGRDYKKQKEMVDLIYPKINKKVKKSYDAAKHFLVSEKIGNVNLFRLKVNETLHRGYPKAGQIVGMIKDDLEKENKNVVMIGEFDDMFIFRASDDSEFDVHEVMESIKKNVSESLVEGGGHKKAGTIKFLSASKDKVFTELKKYLLTI
ncbi:MAG: DHH family phosphoesterase [Candidatus Woesearchaeota archaeon]